MENENTIMNRHDKSRLYKSQANYTPKKKGQSLCALLERHGLRGVCCDKS